MENYTPASDERMRREEEMARRTIAAKRKISAYVCGRGGATTLSEGDVAKIAKFIERIAAQ